MGYTFFTVGFLLRENRIRSVINNEFFWDIKQLLSSPKYLVRFRGSRRFVFLDSERVIFEKLEIISIERIKWKMLS